MILSSQICLMDLSRFICSASCSAATYEEEDVIPILKVKKLELRRLRNLAGNSLKVVELVQFCLTQKFLLFFFLPHIPFYEGRK